MEKKTTAPAVLIVEDDPTIARLIETMLRVHGYRTAVAPDADAAIGHLQTAQPALMTLDLNLPGMSGAALLKAIRAEPLTAKLPVVVITANQHIAPEVRAEADAVITKPFGLEELIAVVRETMDAPPLAERTVGG